MVLLAVLPTLAETVDTAWVRRYNGPGNGLDAAGAIAVDGSGYIYVTGGSYGSETDADYATIKYYPNGDTAWVRRYNGPGNSYDYANAIAVDDLGYVYVTGESKQDTTSSSNYDYCTIKYYPNGDTAWVRRYNGSRSVYDWTNAIAIDDSGNVYVTGWNIGSGTESDYVTIKYYPNGDTAWVRSYNGPGSDRDEAYAIAVDDSGYVYVTGFSVGTGTSSDYATVKYYPNGDTAWVRRYNGPGNRQDEALAIAVDGSNNVYVTGQSYDSATYTDYATIKYYSNGDTAWVRRYNGPGNSWEEARAIAVDDYSCIYVTGSSYGSGTFRDYATIKYYPNGDTAWVRRYNGPGNGWDMPYAIAVDDSNNVYVTGFVWISATDYDHATVKYYPNGDTSWVTRYNGPGNSYDYSEAIAIDDSGNVYVTGGSPGSGTNYDYVTIKYVQGFSNVSIIDFAFIPEVDTISLGDSIRWTNNGAMPHTSTSDAKSLWDSGTLDPGESFTFQFNTVGSYPYHCEFHPSMTGTIVVLSTDVKDETEGREKPSEFALSQNYPNPFNQSTKIEFTLAHSGFASLNIYDILGRKVRTLISEHLSSGYKSVLWDGKNDSGKEVASGIYFYQLRIGDFSATKKLVLLK
jgi:hypothetical protein